MRPMSPAGCGAPGHRTTPPPNPRVRRMNCDTPHLPPSPTPKPPNQAKTPATSATTGGAGAGGRATSTTGTPSRRAATSFPSTAVPPEFLLTTTSIPSARNSAISPSTWNGPRAATHRARAGTTAGSGASTLRIRYSCQGAARNGASSCCPTVRKTRRGAVPNAASASSIDETSVQSSPTPARHAGRSSATRGTPACNAAAAAFPCIPAANGCVASTSAPIPSSRRYATSPATPPNPPRREGTAGKLGARVRPANDSTGRNAVPSSARHNAEASVVPPNTNTFMPGCRA